MGARQLPVEGLRMTSLAYFARRCIGGGISGFYGFQAHGPSVLSEPISTTKTIALAEEHGSQLMASPISHAFLAVGRQLKQVFTMNGDRNIIL